MVEATAAPLRRAVLAVALWGVAGGCGGERTARDEFTAGRITVVAEPEVRDLIAASARDFERLYPDAAIEVREGTSQEAVGALFGARAEAAVVGREALEEERRAAEEANLGVEALRWARDAVAIVVHPDNPVEQIAFDDLREVYTGNVTSWSALGGDETRIVPVVQDPERSITQFFADRILAGAPIGTPARLVEGDEAAAASVAADRNAIAFVTLPFAARGVRALRVSRLKGLPYVELDARNVYEDRYPLTRSYNVFLRRPGARLANGFTTFLCSVDGQRRVRDAGLVPATVPVRFTSRAPTISARRPAESQEGREDHGK